MSPRRQPRTSRPAAWRSDDGASLVFALVAVSITSLVVVSLTSATSGGFLEARAVDATNVDATTITKSALATAVEAVRANPDTGFRSFWSTDARSAAEARCFGATDATTGANYLDVVAADGSTVRVYCSPSARPGTATAANPFIQAAAQPALTDGLVLLHRSTAPALSISGPGTVRVQGGVRANGAISFPGRSGSCPQAASGTTFVNAVGCPQLEVTEVVAGDASASVSATACDPLAIDAAGAVTCNASQSASAPAVPQAAPRSFGTATPARGPLDIDCVDNRATMAPGLYSETATSGVTSLLNAITGSSTTLCVLQTTTLKSTANAGSTSLSVNQRSGFRAGDQIVVGGAGGETLTVRSTYVATTGSGNLTLAAPTTKKWNSASTVDGNMCVKGSGSPCTGAPGTTITSLLLTPGTYFFDLSTNWTVNNPGVTVIGGTENAQGSTAIGDLCVAPTDQGGSGGVVLTFDGAGTSTTNASGYGMVVTSGTVSLCASPPADKTDRPVVLYGSTSALPGSYRKVGATSNASYTFAARGTSCATGTKTNCSIVTVGSTGHLFLYGSVYAPNDDVSLVLGAYDDDQLLLYGVVADALAVTTTQVPVDDAARVRPVAGMPRTAGVELDVVFTAFRCAASCPTDQPGSGQVGEVAVSFVPVTASGVDPRSATLTGPLTSSPFWSVTG